MTEQKSERIVLEEPIRRDGQEITEVVVQQPRPAALLNLSLRDVVDMEAGTMLALLPRITQPPLIQEELLQMSPADFLALSAEASGFLLPKAVRPASPSE